MLSLETVDCVVRTETETSCAPERAVEILNSSPDHVLVLSNGAEAVVMERGLWAWSRADVERLARERGWSFYAYRNRDERTVSGQMTGTGRFRPVARRILSVVA
jgi:hypothetical protein